MTAIAGLALAGRYGQLTWDEAVYASQARSFVSDIPSAYWATYRPPGLPVLGTVAVVGGFSELALRSVSLALNLSTLALAYLLARQVWGRTAAVLTLLALIGSPAVIQEFRQFHNDLPSTGLLIALMILLWDQLERRVSPSWPLLAAGPLAAGAFYLRFGSAAAILAIAITALILWWRTLLVNWRIMAAAIAVGALCFAPHILDSVQLTGSPIGILRRASNVAVWDQSPIAQFLTYVRWLPTRIAGPVPTLFLVAAAVWTVIEAVAAVRARRWAPLRPLFWIVTPGLLAGGAIVATSHVNPRFLMFPLTLGLCAGAGAIVAGVELLGRRYGERAEGWPSARMTWLLVVGVGAASALTVGAVLVGELLRPPLDSRASAAARIANDAAGAPCHVVSGGPPVLAWYSRCAADPPNRAAEAIERPAQWKVYVDLTKSDTATDAGVAELRSIIASEGWPQLPASQPDDGHVVYVRP